MNLHYILTAWLSLVHVGLYAGENNHPPSDVEPMRSSISHLLPTNYTFVDLGFNDNEQTVFERLKVETSEQYHRFGDIGKMKEELPEYLRKIGNDDEDLIKEATELLYRLASTVTSAAQKQTAWVCIRASMPGPQFDMPRWHTDGAYYSPHYSVQYKFAAALKGNATLFFPMNDEMRQVYEANYNDREFLGRYFDVQAAESAQKGQGAFFLVGHKGFAALHSEPCFDSPRLFISVLPGHSCEIEELHHRWTPISK